MKGTKHILLFLFLFFSGLSFGNNSFSDVNFTDNTIRIYPIPVTGNEFNIESTNQNIVEVKIITILGQQVYSNTELNQRNIRIDLENKLEGLYILQIKTADKGVKTERILFK